MPLSGMMMVKEELNQIDGENTAEFLRAQGFVVILSSDDAGGMVPSLEEITGVGVYVPEADAERARALLEEAEQAARADSAEKGED